MPVKKQSRLCKCAVCGCRSYYWCPVTAKCGNCYGKRRYDGTMVGSSKSSFSTNHNDSYSSYSSPYSSPYTSYPSSSSYGSSSNYSNSNYSNSNYSKHSNYSNKSTGSSNNYNSNGNNSNYAQHQSHHMVGGCTPSVRGKASKNRSKMEKYGIYNKSNYSDLSDIIHCDLNDNDPNCINTIKGDSALEVYENVKL
eukprot:336507_1